MRIVWVYGDFSPTLYIQWSCPNSGSAYLNLVTDKFVFVVVKHCLSHKAFIGSGV